MRLHEALGFLVYSFCYTLNGLGGIMRGEGEEDAIGWQFFKANLAFVP